ncbi:WD repeat- and FYVE domain-containing protein 4 isoform X3 [Thamnophis elegans]|uniref:WD repeat- and FYVE domain-containing protein 4 isoform X3 n=1 Tax=Thamnophis elegans TaxID=35005 RepID=UPI00137717A8|nr:WD repeat- and FYVE domain-containing protein 4 isoform X3 [Thamnophis elegans]
MPVTWETQDHFDQSMEPVLELPKALAEKADSPDEHGSQDPTLPKGGHGAAVRERSTEPPCQQLSFRRETLDRHVSEYMEVALFLSPEEQQRRWLPILAAFLKAWEQSDGSIYFPNIQLLASETSSFLVKEIKTKMNGNPAEDARLLVWQFLQWKGELDSAGYLLLKSIYSLSLYTSEQELRWNIIKSGLPVTLLQCLHLFFVSAGLEAAPWGRREEEEEEEEEEEQALRETQEMLVQTMVNIYEEKQGVEMLLMSSHLKSLIIARSSRWDQGSPAWKQPASRVLRAISEALSETTISYLQDCIKTSIHNLSELDDSSPTWEVCESINIILHFVRNSYPISPALLLEFENNGGHQLLLKFFLRYEGPLGKKENASIKETLDLVTQLALCGETELRVSCNIVYPQLPQFNDKLPQLNEKLPLSSGKRIRNLKAFQVLELLFQKSSNPNLCQYILLALKSLWTWDPMNFFLLEWSLQPICQFVGVIPLKPFRVQAQFFQLVESVVKDLSYLPHEILKKIQCLINENARPSCTSLALGCLHSITQREPLLTDIFRDSGLLGMLLVQLRKEAKRLIKKGSTQASPQVSEGEDLLKWTLKMAAALVEGSVRNTVILRDYGMVPYIKIYVDSEVYRSDAVNILEQVSIVNPEEYMSSVVGALCSSTQGELHFKLDLLKSLLKTLVNPKGRSAFRTSSGFNGLFSLLADMEGSLQDSPSGAWASFGQSHILGLILRILQTMAAALYLDPANKGFFQENGLFERMAEDLGTLGCFSAQRWGQIPTQINKPRSFVELSNTAACSPELFPTRLKSCIRIFSFLDSMARMNPFGLKSCLEETDPPPTLGVRNGTENQQEDSPGNLWDHRKSNEVAAVQLPEPQNRPQSEDPVIVCPGALCVMVTLIGKLYNEAYPELSLEIQFAVADHIQSLMGLEKNRQVACTAGLLGCLVSSCPEVLHDASSPLHAPLIRLFEKLASQSIQPEVLRQFLCPRMMPLPVATPPLLSLPPASLSDGEELDRAQKMVDLQSKSCEKQLKGSGTAARNDSTKQSLLGSDPPECSAMALQTAMSLISLTTPRSLHLHSACLAPSFVEFDMSLDGYGCLFIPSMATILGQSTEHSVLGGTGKGIRRFPPPDGLTFSSWFLINKMSSARDYHPLRFLTLMRHMARTEEVFACFAVRFSPVEGCLTISTEEVAFEDLDTMVPEDETSLLCQVRFRCAPLLVPGQWHHLAVTVAKETKQICTVSAYLNGSLVGSAKMQYIRALPGSFTSMDPSSFIDVFGFVATPLMWRKRSSLSWRQGPMFLFEEVLSMETLQLMGKLGPRYYSNFQAVELRGEGSHGHLPKVAPLVAPEKISFGLNTRCSFYTTVKGIKDSCGEVDGRLVAKELKLSSRDNITPVFMAQNTAAKLPGCLRTIGAIVVGQHGTHVFQSCPAVVSLSYLGGPSLLLALLARAQDDHAVYAAVKVLQTVMSCSAVNERLMGDEGDGYQILAYLLKKKAHLLNSRILHLVLSIGGTMEAGLEQPTIKNLEIFQHIVCNFELWCSASGNLDLPLFKHLTEVLQSSRGKNSPVNPVRQAQMVPKLFLLLGDPGIPASRVRRICLLLHHSLRGHFSIQDLCWIGLFLVYTLSPASIDENETFSNNIPEPFGQGLTQAPGKMVWLRNQLLSMLLDVLEPDKPHSSSVIQEEMFQALGPDWFLMFMQSHVHRTTIVLAAKLLFHFLHNHTNLQEFREGMMAGLWLKNSLEGLNILTDNLKSSPQSFEYQPYPLSGLMELKMFLSSSAHIPEIPLLLSGLLLDTPGSKPPDDTQAGLGAMLEWLLGHRQTERVAKDGLCAEAAVLLLGMVSSLTSQIPAEGEDSWQTGFIQNILHFVHLVYQRYPQDPLWSSSPFLQALALAAFPSGPPQPPARKDVWDLVQLLLMGMMLLDWRDKSWHPLELMLEASPENAAVEQKMRFQTELLLSIMEIVYNLGQNYKETSTLTTGNGDTRNILESDRPHFLGNVGYFTRKLVSKLHEGVLVTEPRKTILFIAEQVQLVTRKLFLHKESIMSNLYNCLNHAILYYLSNSSSGPQSLLEVLQTLQMRWDVIFAVHNSSLDFIASLLYCLLQLKSISYHENGEAKWMPASGYSLGPRKEEEGIDDLSALKDVQQEIQRAAEEIWLRLLSRRRRDLEDAYKTSLFKEEGDGEERMKMEDVAPLWEEAMRKTWQAFLASGKKASQSRILISVSSRTSPLSESLKQDFTSYLEKCRRTGQELYAVLCKDHVERALCLRLKSAKAWTELEDRLFREGGPWGSAVASPVTRWVRDAYEGPARMRKRIQFKTAHRAAELLQDKAQQTQKKAASAPAYVGNPGERPTPTREGEAGRDQLTFFPALGEHLHSEEFVEFVCVERKIVLQELVQDEKVTCRLSVVVVDGHAASEGALLLGRDHFYVCKHFALSHLGEVYCTSHCLSCIREPFIYNLCHATEAAPVEPTCSCHSYRDIREIRPMRFLLQEIALEIFLNNGYSIFLVFHNNDREKFLTRFCSVRSKGVADESTNIRKQSEEKKSFLLKWQRREISNFEYLMYLNSLAGRTHSDLMQYPVFPWVLADYQSQTLDLTNPGTFRDLSKPMGAQTEGRKEKFIQRFKEVEKTEGNLSAQSHYFTHYSSAMIVASYLVRLEPFTETFRSLQGGDLDVADRMFHSVRSTWESASRDNMTDVRELIPEFFYLPEFLTNHNHIDFGCLQDGTRLNDVDLPPWAGGNPHRFIRLHRQALESDFVSSRLHHWIDLIFGSKQQGPAAVKAVNTFHPYFYSDQAQMGSIEDPLVKSTVLGFVSNFGQMPKQLFTKPHPSRNAASLRKPSLGKSSFLLASPALSVSHLHHLKESSVVIPREAPQGPVGHIVCTEKGILAVEKKSILLPPLWNQTFCWGFSDFTCCLADAGSEKKITVLEAPAEWGDCLCAVSPTPSRLITSGSSCVVCVWDLCRTPAGATALRLKQPLYGHTQPVTCLAASTAYSLLVSGSADGSCLFWDLNRLTCLTRLPAQEAGLSAVAINDSTGEVASCAGATLGLWTVNGQPLGKGKAPLRPGGRLSCCCFFDVKDWDAQSLIVTGDTDGCVQVWKPEAASPGSPGEQPLGEAEAGKRQGQQEGGRREEAALVLRRELLLRPSPPEGAPRPASPITALAASRNYSKLLAGNEEGKVCSWSIEE